MIFSDLKECVDRIHNSSFSGVIAATGGGTGIIDELLRRGGGSSTLLEAVVPYSMNAWKKFIGGTPDRATSEYSARQLAVAAYQRALQYSDSGPNHFGFGITASLAKNGPERAGRQHHVHIAFQSDRRCDVISYDLFGTREEQEKTCIELGIKNLLASIELCSVDIPPQIIDSYNQTFYDVHRPSNRVSDLVMHPNRGNVYYPHEQVLEPKLIFPGSFNPLHDAHLEVARIASEITKQEAVFEISAQNCSKPPLDFIEIRKRIKHFEDKGIKRLVLTDAALFKDKAKIFPGATFVLGIDTWIRTVKCDDNDTRVALDEFEKHGIKFMIFGREHNGSFLTADKIKVPDHPYFNVNSSNVYAVSEYVYKMDLASSKIRKAAIGETDDF